MEIGVVLRTFGVIFLAELGDKTQLAIFSMASSTQARWGVFLGSALALACTSLLAVLLGDGLSRLVPEHLLSRGVGLLFIGVGVWYLLGRG